MKITSPLHVVIGFALAHAATAKSIPNNAAADLVLGQPGFTTNTVPITSAASISASTSVVVDPMTRKVFVGDQNGDRVLRYASAAALANGASAEAVFGQARFSTQVFNSPTAELGMSDPNALFFDRKGRLWVADSSNNRVLMYESASFRNSQPYSDIVLGQTNFLNIAAGVTAARMDTPNGVWVDANDRLWVADSGNNRILRFDNVSLKPTSGSADGVLGQANFTTKLPGTTAASFSKPLSVTLAATGALFVADFANNRVLRFDNAAGKALGANADAVLGQASFGPVAFNVTDTTMHSPAGVTCTPDDALWVTDQDNNRIIRFDSASTKPSGAAANGVLGQPNFTTRLTALTDRGLTNPAYACFADALGALWVPDQVNNRVLRFPADETPPLLTVTTVVPKMTKAKKLTLNGTASDANGVVLVQFKVNAGPIQTAVGTTAWQINPALRKGKNTITVFATDTGGNVSLSTVLKTKRK